MDEITLHFCDFRSWITNLKLPLMKSAAMKTIEDLEQYLSSSSSTKYLNDYSALFHPKRLLIEEIDEVTIQVQNLSEHPSLYETQDLGKKYL